MFHQILEELNHFPRELLYQSLIFICADYGVILVKYMTKTVVYYTRNYLWLIVFTFYLCSTSNMTRILKLNKNPHTYSFCDVSLSHLHVLSMACNARNLSLCVVYKSRCRVCHRKTESHAYIFFFFFILQPQLLRVY